MCYLGKSRCRDSFVLHSFIEESIFSLCSRGCVKCGKLQRGRKKPLHQGCAWEFPPISGGDGVAKDGENFCGAFGEKNGAKRVFLSNFHISGLQKTPTQIWGESPEKFSAVFAVKREVFHMREGLSTVFAGLSTGCRSGGAGVAARLSPICGILFQQCGNLQPVRGGFRLQRLFDGIEERI